jgi:hypothetical protein
MQHSLLVKKLKKPYLRQMQTNDFYLKFDINANLLISSKKSVHSHLPILGIVVSLSLSGFDTLITTKTKQQDGL